MDDLSEKEGKDLQARISTLESKIKKCTPSLSVQSGPVVSAVQATLKRHNIVQQAYHSRSFVGNHCSKYLKSCVQDDIHCTILEKVSDLCKKSDTYDKASDISCKFLALNKIFSEIHYQVGHMDKVTSDVLLNIKNSIAKYLEYYRQCFPNLLIPKHHFLEDHVIDWIEKWYFGMGFHGEQGGESIHREFNRIQRNMCHVTNHTKKLLFIMREHHTLTNPAIQSPIVKPKKTDNFKKQPTL